MIGFLFFVVCFVFDDRMLRMWFELCIDDIFGFVMISVLLVKYIVCSVLVLILVGEL